MVAKADLQQNTQLEHSCVGGGTFRTRVLDETFDSIFWSLRQEQDGKSIKGLSGGNLYLFL